MIIVRALTSYPTPNAFKKIRIPQKNLQSGRNKKKRDLTHLSKRLSIVLYIQVKKKKRTKYNTPFTQFIRFIKEINSNHKNAIQENSKSKYNTINETDWSINTILILDIQHFLYHTISTIKIHPTGYSLLQTSKGSAEIQLCFMSDKEKKNKITQYNVYFNAFLEIIIMNKCGIRQHS